MKRMGLADSPFFFQQTEGEQNISGSLNSKTLRNRNSLLSNVCLSIQSIGKEASTYRLSKEEKRKLTKIIYKFRIKERCLTENIIIRLSLNYIFLDYIQNDETSILSKVVNKMNF